MLHLVRKMAVVPLKIVRFSFRKKFLEAESFVYSGALLLCSAPLIGRLRYAIQVYSMLYI